MNREDLSIIAALLGLGCMLALSGYTFVFVVAQTITYFLGG